MFSSLPTEKKAQWFHYVTSMLEICMIPDSANALGGAINKKCLKVFDGLSFAYKYKTLKVDWENYKRCEIDQ